MVGIDEALGSDCYPRVIQITNHEVKCSQSDCVIDVTQLIELGSAAEAASTDWAWSSMSAGWPRARRRQMGCEKAVSCLEYARLGA